MKIRIIGGIALLLFFIGMAIGGTAWYMLESPLQTGDKPLTLYIDNDDSKDSVMQKVQAGMAMQYLLEQESYHVRTGYYEIPCGESVLDAFRRLRSGKQTAINLVIPSVRTLDRLAGNLSKHLMLDSAEIASALYDNDFCQNYGYTVETMPALFIPNTYQCYWDMTLERLMQRMKQVNEEFWNDERDKKASLINMTHEEVVTLASIVDSETASNAEKPRVAGLYMNRLLGHIPLQADPTVIFAVGDFSIRRVLNKHLQTPSPYNTYLNIGLPPGPIRIASIAGIDAVLNYERHAYLYMCAKEDFSGTHNFAERYAEHLANARRYTNALNKRNILQ